MWQCMVSVSELSLASEPDSLTRELCLTVKAKQSMTSGGTTAGTLFMLCGLSEVTEVK